jgi:dipeptidyl aminopeptidase/acylaminoacyl peptidase
VRRYTLPTHVDSEPQWSPSGASLAFVSDRSEASEIWVMPTDGGEARRVTDVVGAVSNVRWSPDGTALTFVQATTEEERAEGHDRTRDSEYERTTPDPLVTRRFVYREHGEYRQGRRRHVYTVDVDDDSVTRVTDGDYDFENPSWGDETTLYYTVKRTGDPDDTLTHDIVRHDLAEDAAETVCQTTGWLPAYDVDDRGRIAYRHSRDEEPGPSMYTTNLKVYDPETGETTTPTRTFDRRIYRDCTPQWGPDGAVYFLYPDRGEVNLARVDPESTSPETLLAPGGHIQEVDVTTQGIAFVQSDWDYPSDVFVADFDGSVRRVTELNDAYLAARSIAEPEEHWFESHDGTEIQGWLLTPPSEARRDVEGTPPLVVEIHGGPSIMWSTSGTMWHEFQLLAAAGYAVFWCNPRGSTGYGEAHSLAIAEDWGSIDFADIVSGVDSVSDRDDVGDRQFVTGGSYGGFMTAWAITHTDRFDAAVAQRGVYDQMAQFGGTDTYHSSERQLGLPWEDPETYWDASPTAHIESVSTPTLLIHSEQDYRVPIHNADALYRHLKKVGVEVEYVRYPREGHELSRAGEPQHVVDRLERIREWFDVNAT